MMQEPKSIIFFFFSVFFFQSAVVQGQLLPKNFVYQYSVNGVMEMEEWKETDSLQLNNRIDRVIYKLKSSGYLLAQLDSVVQDSFVRKFTSTRALNLHGFPFVQRMQSNPKNLKEKSGGMASMVG
ncbi:MAG: hypothetical protein IPL25_15625 [Saprospiraceae bacterium]|nr:hypothetical protein [Candidatus Vicinibacter affinis]